MNNEQMYNLYLLIKDLEELKNKSLKTFTSEGKQESIAEHLWRVSLMAMTMAPNIKGIKLSKALQMCMVCELGKLYIPEQDIINSKYSYKDELRSVHKIASYLPVLTSKHIIDLWKEYKQGETTEAKFVRAINSLETLAQINNAAFPADYSYTEDLYDGINEFKVTKDFSNIVKDEIKYNERVTIKKNKVKINV